MNAAPHAERDDHQAVIGHLGVGWFGISNIIIDTSANGSTNGIISAPVLGVRYWFTELVGLDAGIGFAISNVSASVEAGAMSMDQPGAGAYGVLIHAGLPLAFASGRHYAFILVPEFNVGFASQKTESGVGQGEVDIKNSGFRFDLGGRAGAEVQFGFMGVPELALEASIGLYLSRVTVREEQGEASRTVGMTSLSTTSLNNPWDFFRTAVAARYYF